MSRKIQEDVPKIQMLLDIENIFGESTRGLGITVLTLVVAIIPPLIIGYFSLYLFIPVWLLVIFCLFWAFRVFLIIKGRERDRIKAFKAQLDSNFLTSMQLVGEKTIHENGCIEYINGEVGFLVETYNMSSMDTLIMSRDFDRFISVLCKNYAFDVYFHNVTEVQELDDSYERIHLFKDEEVAKDFTKTIDYTKSLMEKSSTMLRTLFLVKSGKSDWKKLQADVKDACKSDISRIFKVCRVLEKREEIEAAMSRDINGNLDLEKMQRERYKSGTTKGSEIISYDYKDVEEVIEKEQRENDSPGFMQTWNGGE